MWTAIIVVGLGCATIAFCCWRFRAKSPTLTWLVVWKQLNQHGKVVDSGVWRVEAPNPDDATTQFRAQASWRAVVDDADVYIICCTTDGTLAFKQFLVSKCD